jgi:glutathione synthase
MQFLFVIDPLGTLKAYKDSTVAMMRESQRRGHQVWVCEQTSIAHHRGSVSCEAQRIALTEDDEDWLRRHEQAQRALTSFDAVVMRKDPPFDLEYVTSTWLLSAAERDGACIVNSPSAVRDHNEKIAILEFPQFNAPTLVTRDAERVHAFIDEHGDAVVKRLDTMGGENIFRVRADDLNRNAIIEIMLQGGARSLMIQRFIPEIAEGDKRILLIGGQVVPYSLARIPKAGEARGNLAAGGRGEARELSQRDREIAATIAPLVAQRGLLLVGLDVIGDWLTEVNVTSPTCFREIMDQTGYDVAALFVDGLERAAAERAAQARA